MSAVIIPFPSAAPRSRAPVSTLRSRVLAVCDGLTADERRIVIDSCERLAGVRHANLIVSHAHECAQMMRSADADAVIADRIVSRVRVAAKHRRVDADTIEDMVGTALRLHYVDRLPEVEIVAWARDYADTISGPPPPEAA